MTHFIPLAPHYLPDADTDLPVLDTGEARSIASGWISPAQTGLTAFATGARLDDDTLVTAVRDTRVQMAECPDPDLHRLLVHLQDLCVTRGVTHRDEDVWCWCEPYRARNRASLSAAS